MLRQLKLRRLTKRGSSYFSKRQAKTQVEWTEDQRRDIARLFGAGNKSLAE